MKIDTLIEQALVVDGSGAPAFMADVAVDQDRIVSVGKSDQFDAKTRLAADGLVLSPGFIDAHTHDDRALLAYPDMTPKLSQGVTCVITGNCGISISPLHNKEPLPPLNLLGEKQHFQYPDFTAYAEHLDKQPAAINSAMLTGHSTLRVGTMSSLDRAATHSEIDAMCQLLEQSLTSGSIGLSTGLAYPLAIHAPADEVVELAHVVKEFDGMYTTHMRSEEDDVMASIEETLSVGVDATVPIVISHHKVCGKANWGRTAETISRIEQARTTQQVDCDVYPYTASSTVLLPEFVARAERVMVTWSKSLPEFSTWDLSDIAQEMRCDTSTAIERLQPAGAVYWQMCDEDLERVLSFEGAMIGSDGLPHDPHPHPRLWGTFPRVLGLYSRQKKLFNLEQAVHRMTGKTANVFGLKDRGLIREGYFADLVLFDAKSVIDRATYQEPDLPSQGIHTVFVNGKVAFNEGKTSDSRNGRLLLNTHSR